MTRTSSPTHLYSLALCVHLIAYVCSLIGAFTPDWSTVSEMTGAGVKTSYDKGVIVSCNIPGGPTGCAFNKDISGSSTLFFTCFLVVISYIVIGFFALQFLVAGCWVRSLSERNLGIYLLMFFMVLTIVLFEVSITKDTTAGNDYDSHTFGISRYALVGATVLYFVCTFFALGEHIKRKSNSSVTHVISQTVVAMDSIPSKSYSNNNYKNNTDNNKTNGRTYNVGNRDGKFSKREKRPPKYDDYNMTPNQNNQSTSSIIPFSVHSYVR